MSTRKRWNGLTDTLSGFATRPFNVLANLASIVGLVVTLLALLKWSYLWILALYLCAMSLFLMIRYIRQERWARYAEANISIEKGLRRLKEVSDRLIFRTCSDDDFIEGLGFALGDIAVAFSLVTGSTCRATLKEVYYEEVFRGSARIGIEGTNELCAASMARSDPEKNLKARREAPVLVTANSDFDHVVSESTPFFSNDLPSLWRNGNYKNSHWSDSLQTSRDFPYRSAIVWPIEADRPGVDWLEETDGKRERVIALLCIDSKRTGAFRRATDVPMGGLFAHALYPVLRYHFGD